MVLLLSAQSLLHGRVKLRAVRVEDLALPVGVLHAASADLDATLVQVVRLQLQVVLLLRVRAVHRALIAVVLA